ncbi:hypothetical protein BHE74_00046080 [Ensete ventricosum]|nr:hypothetical protein BHE74_00046080 [Ensete ventricosum]
MIIAIVGIAWEVVDGWMKVVAAVEGQRGTKNAALILSVRTPQDSKLGMTSSVSGSKQRSVAYMETDTNPSDWSVASDDGMDFPMTAYLATHLVFTFSANFKMQQA